MLSSMCLVQVWTLSAAECRASEVKLPAGKGWAMTRLTQRPSQATVSKRKKQSLCSALRPLTRLSLESCVLWRCCREAQPGGSWQGCFSLSNGCWGVFISPVQSADGVAEGCLQSCLYLRLSILCNVLLKTKGQLPILSNAAPLWYHEVA